MHVSSRIEILSLGWHHKHSTFAISTPPIQSSQPYMRRRHRLSRTPISSACYAYRPRSSRCTANNRPETSEIHPGASRPHYHPTSWPGDLAFLNARSHTLHQRLNSYRLGISEGIFCPWWSLDEFALLSFSPLCKLRASSCSSQSSIFVISNQRKRKWHLKV